MGDAAPPRGDMQYRPRSQNHARVFCGSGNPDEGQIRNRSQRTSRYRRIRRTKDGYTTFAYSFDRNSMFVSRGQNYDISDFIGRRLQTNVGVSKLVSFESKNVLRFSGRQKFMLEFLDMTPCSVSVTTELQSKLPQYEFSLQICHDIVIIENEPTRFVFSRILLIIQSEPGFPCINFD